LIAFFSARADRGWFGFHDQPGLNPSPEAALAVFSEIVVLATCAVLIALAFVPRRRAAHA
jgi:hypothetical protein